MSTMYIYIYVCLIDLLARSKSISRHLGQKDGAVPRFWPVRNEVWMDPKMIYIYIHMYDIMYIRYIYIYVCYIILFEYYIILYFII
jgi:hypothetical protein